MIDLYGVLQEQETVNGELGLGVDYYKGEQGEQGIPGKDGKDGSDQVYVGAEEPTDERVKLWIDTDATPPSKVVSWDEIENKPNLADVATSGDYNDLSNKPIIPSIDGLASEAYVNEKVAAIVIPEVPTKVSAFENDSGYLTEHQSLAEYAKKTEIPAPYTLPTASTSTLGGVKVDGSTITIADGVISSVGSTELDAYIKDASVSGNTLTLTKKDNTNIVFTPSGGSSGGSDGLQRIFSSQLQVEDVVSQNSAYIGKIVYDYNTDNQYLVLKDQKIAEVKAVKNINPMSLLSSQSEFNKNKDWVLQWIKNKSYNVTVNGCPIIDTRAVGSTFYYYWIDNLSGLALNQGYIKFTNNDQTTLENYNNQQKYNFSSEYLLTSSNWQNYITVSSGSDWQYTQDNYDSNLYNAKELVVYAENTQGNRQMGYFNFGANGSNLGNFNGYNFYFDYDTSSPYIYYNGSGLGYGNVNNLFYIYYKT